MQKATRDVLEPLVEAAGGPDRTAIVTLAPEVDPGLRGTRWLSGLGIRVAAGHTDAPLPVLRDAEAAGISLFTHLGNGCANTINRHDNIINRALSLEKMVYTLVPDGFHVPWFVLKSWIKLAGVPRCLFTTDCVAPAGAPPGRYTVGHFDVDVGADGMVRPAGRDHLAGSALTMKQAHVNATTHLGLSEAEARALLWGQQQELFARWLGPRDA
jgi:N-acetylglucosamine-6-phosphate deacetylase